MRLAPLGRCWTPCLFLCYQCAMERTSWPVNEIAALSPADAADLAALREACHAVDQPDAPPAHRGDPTAVIRDDAGTIVAELVLRLAAPGSGSHATMDLAVHPEHRRRGMGSALMEHALARASEGQQTSLMTIVHQQWPGGPARSDAGRAFVESYGFELANTEVRSRVGLADVGRVGLAGVREEGALAAAAEAASADFDTVWWVDQIPEELLAGAAALHGTFSTEAPMGQLQVRATTVSVDQLRQEAAAAAEHGTFRCGVLAVHRPSGAVVGSTFIIAPQGEPADQRLTLVAPEFRGHRLSMRLKIENLRQLRQQRPDLTEVWTENAESNTPMRRVNEQLGFEPVDYAIRYHHLW